MLLRRWAYVINGTRRATLLEQGKLRGVDTWVRPTLFEDAEKMRTGGAPGLCTLPCSCLQLLVPLKTRFQFAHLNPSYAHGGAN